MGISASSLPIAPDQMRFKWNKQLRNRHVIGRDLEFFRHSLNHRLVNSHVPSVCSRSQPKSNCQTLHVLQLPPPSLTQSKSSPHSLIPRRDSLGTRRGRAVMCKQVWCSPRWMQQRWALYLQNEEGFAIGSQSKWLGPAEI